MASSLNDMVSAISPTIPPSLISPHALEAIAAVAKHFPITLSTTVGFECPLAAGAEADFFLRVSGAWGQALLAGESQTPPILDQLRLEPELFPPGFALLWDAPLWQRIREFARLWAEPNSLLHQAVEDLWLEFDTASGDTSGITDHGSEIPDQQRTKPIPLPSTFFGVKSPGIPSWEWLSQSALPTLLGEPLSIDAELTLQHCLVNIPAAARLFQVGLLSGRTLIQGDSPAMRLYIQDMPLAQLRSTLSRLSWVGDAELLTQLLTRVCQSKGRFSVQLEIQDALSPVIAIECYFHHRTEWQQVLNRLVSTGFCSPERAQALLNYPGYVRAQDHLAPFPKLLESWSAQLSPYRECFLVKRLAYLKFTYQPGCPLLAKAYLGLSPTWIDSRYLDLNDPVSEHHSDQESLAISLCKALIQQLDYSEIDVDELFPCQRSQKSQWLNKALELMCVGG